MAARMPALFVGHGSPMNAIEDNRWSRGFIELAKLLPRPKAVLSISAHWYTEGSWLTAEDAPRTIHDFGGFPDELFAMQYPARGEPALAKRVAELTAGRAKLSTEWGLDHGTWTVLHYLLPKADVPVVQLSIDASLPGAEHVALGRALQPLRDEGVLVMGSGNITHNLRHAFTSFRRGETATPDWAAKFDGDVARALEQHDHAFLAGALESDAGRLSHPTPDHYLPLLYTAGAAEARDAVSFPLGGFDLSSLSMRSVIFGAS